MGDQVNLAASSSFRNTPKYSFTSSAVTGKVKVKNVPGPGQYALTNSEKDKYAKSPSYSIGGGSKDGKAWGAMPGPGAYTPANPAFTSPKWPFSTDSRLKTGRASSTPGPGNYDLKTTLAGKDTSIASKPEFRLRSTTPGPGAYNANFSSCSSFESAPKVGFGNSNRGKLAPSKTPGPGNYEIPTTLIGNITMKTPCAYSIKGRYEPPKADQTPGPSLLAPPSNEGPETATVSSKSKTQTTFFKQFGNGLSRCFSAHAAETWGGAALV
eukprot:CAMPEP_0197623090 /NCGR_PEP_ID=MMETSP1338-20131121/3164_1 /TAXON_ID=43686 ORGANISM="Pelagodinium beii, Strain RCC1491" /NCGR_SAMPLE_ID=MMETSP1338 /ASSEMBLY_ACC=CAM_ASM_000754 /LENGTH=267 /DNA_ID=CAMNT_0043192941 /DNA_START=90 /DNA_END=891 /DNA_ORIENTATION=+